MTVISELEENVEDKCKLGRNVINRKGMLTDYIFKGNLIYVKCRNVEKEGEVI